MPSQPRNMPEQERSIKARSHELFVEPGQPGEGTRATKPFPAYIRETPAQPMSPATKAIFWILGTVVALLFLAAVWRITQHHRPQRPARKPPAKRSWYHPRGELEHRIADRLDAAVGPSILGVAGFPDAKSPGTRPPFRPSSTSA